MCPNECSPCLRSIHPLGEGLPEYDFHQKELVHYQTSVKIPAYVTKDRSATSPAAVLTSIRGFGGSAGPVLHPERSHHEVGPGIR